MSKSAARHTRETGLTALGSSFALILAIQLGACLGEVEVPDCVKQHNCPQGGEGGEAPSGGGTDSGGRPTQTAGTAGTEAMAGDGPVTGGGAGDGGEGGTESVSECACRINLDELTAPCAGQPYLARVTALQGVGPYRWQLSGEPAGWTIASDPADDSRGMIQATKVGDESVELTVILTDATGASTSKNYELTPRTACYFGYTTQTPEGAQLRLVDPLADAPVPAPLERNADVFDFQFSPDGKYLAFSYGADEAKPRGAHLALVNLETLIDEPLPFGEDSISAFAWSPSGQTLAVSFITADKGYLAAVESPAGAGKKKTVLASTPAFTTTELHWVGEEHVAYFSQVSPDPENPGEFVPDNIFRTPFYAALAENGFEAPTATLEIFTPEASLRSAGEGFMVITKEAPWTIFYDLSDAGWASSHPEVHLAAPSGRYVSFLDGNQLLNVEESNVDSLVGPFAVATETCPMPLAWTSGAPGSGVERIACLIDVTNENGVHGEVRIFDIDGDTGKVPSATLGGSCDADVATVGGESCAVGLTRYAYSTSLATGAARAFSPSGRYFAFSSVNHEKMSLYLADLDHHPITLGSALQREIPGADGPPTSLAFSSDESLLLLQLGKQLHVIDVATGELRSSPNDQLPISNKCTEDFPTAPDTYCGNTDNVAPMLWAPRSRHYAFRSPGALIVTDISFQAGLRSAALPANACGDACSGRFAFQPNP